MRRSLGSCSKTIRPDIYSVIRRCRSSFDGGRWVRERRNYVLVLTSRNFADLKMGLPTNCPQDLSYPAQRHVFEPHDLTIDDGATRPQSFSYLLLGHFPRRFLSEK